MQSGEPPLAATSAQLRATSQQWKGLPALNSDPAGRLSATARNFCSRVAVAEEVELHCAKPIAKNRVWFSIAKGAINKSFV